MERPGSPRYLYLYLFTIALLDYHSSFAINDTQNYHLQIHYASPKYRLLFGNCWNRSSYHSPPNPYSMDHTVHVLKVLSTADP